MPASTGCGELPAVTSPLCLVQERHLKPVDQVFAPLAGVYARLPDAAWEEMARCDDRAHNFSSNES
jgi:hypothetical protein